MMQLINAIFDILIISGLVPLLTVLAAFFLKNRVRYLGVIGFIGYLVLILYILQDGVWNGNLKLLLMDIPGSSSLSINDFSKFFILVFSILALPTYLHSINYMEKDRNLGSYYTLLGIMMFGLIGLTLADDLFTFFVFWEAMAISSYILVGFRYHLDEPLEAAVKYIVISGVASLLLLYGISFVYGLVGALTLENILIYLEGVAGQSIYPIILAGSLFMIGFGVKAAYFPLWTWLPDAHPAAPSPISALLSGIVIKAGILGLAKFGIPFFLVEPKLFYPTFLVITLLTLTVANLMALMQSDIKRLLAYSSIANIGFILIGYTVAVKGYIDIGLASAFAHVFTHALGKGAAFLAVGAILYLIHTRDISQLEGFGRVYPSVAIILMLSLLSLGGLPPLPGFWSKWLLILSAVEAGEYLLAFFGVFNSVLAVIYYMWLFQRFFFSQPSEELKEVKSVPPYLGSSLMMLGIILLSFGLFPNFIYIPAYSAASYIASLLESLL
ncbi:MAG TPA: hypothetical protein EYH44_05010 [Thermoprotei archaeon]|nr:hypothetical protein [Thermoprotei archaeon]